MLQSIYQSNRYWFAGLLCVFLASCGTPSNSSSKTQNPDENDPKTVRVVERPATSEFIVDRKTRTIEENGVKRVIDEGPLLGYKIRMNYALDPDKSQPVREGRLFGETVVFGIPDGKGDTGLNYQTALNRAADLTNQGKLPKNKMESEFVEEGNIALVKFETPGFPSGQKSGVNVPVAIVPLGNARSVVGGHIYATDLHDAETGEKLAYCSYRALWEEDVVSHETFFKDRNLRTIFDPEGALEEDPVGDTKDHNKKDRVIRHFIVKDLFKLMRSTGWKEPGRDEIVLHIGWKRQEYIEGVYRALTESAELSKKTAEFRVTRDALNESKLYVVPSLREGTISSFYDDIRSLFFEVKPRTKLHLLVDEDHGRILVVGPQSRRRVLNDFDFGLKRRNIKEYQPSGRFRLVGKRSRDRTKLNMSWTRYDGKTVVEEGSATIENDFGAVLRLAYDKGMSVNDTIALVLEAASDLRYVNAQLIRHQVVQRVKSAR